MRFLVGGNTADKGGAATGIGMLLAGAAADVLAGGPLGFTGDAAVTGGSPSWVSPHPSLDVVYAALEKAGTVRAFRRTGATSYVALGDPVAAGEAVCHIAVAPDGASLIASCWGDGQVVRMTLDATGRPSAPVTAAAASDPYGDGDGDGDGTGMGTRAGSGSIAGFGSVAGSTSGWGRGSGSGPDSGFGSGSGPDSGFGGAFGSGSGFGAGAGSGLGVGVGAGDPDLVAAARALREAAGEEYADVIPHLDDGAGPGGPGGPTAAGSVGPRSDAAGDDVSEGAAISEPPRISRAHQARFLPNGIVVTTDMGLDLVRMWRTGPRGLVAGEQIVLPAGSGPRHMVWHPSGHLYVLTELSHEVFVLTPDAAGVWRVVAGTPLGAGVLAGDTAAELCASRDAEFLYAGVRGSNTLATLRVRGDGSTVTPVALVEAGVDWPRHHVVVRDTLLVAGQRSNEVASHTLDLRTGVPERIRHRTTVPSPTCLLPIRA